VGRFVTIRTVPVLLISGLIGDVILTRGRIFVDRGIYLFTMYRTIEVTSKKNWVVTKTQVWNRMREHSNGASCALRAVATAAATASAGRKRRWQSSGGPITPPPLLPAESKDWVNITLPYRRSASQCIAHLAARRRPPLRQKLLWNCPLLFSDSILRHSLCINNFDSH
jgi:hypothetical protein